MGSLSPDNILDSYNNDYKWLVQVYQSVKPSSDNVGKLLWLTLGAQTTKLIHENVHVGDIYSIDEFIDDNVVEDIFNNPNPKKVNNLKRHLLIDLKVENYVIPRFKSLSERLEELKDKAERGLITVLS